MKHVIHRATTVAVLVLGAGVALAQNPPRRPPPPDTAAVQPAPGMGMQPGMEMQPGMGMRMQGRPDRERLQQQIQERFAQRVQTELGLNDQQMERLRQAGRTNEDRHRDLGRREADLHRAAVAQLQPGVAANQDSLARLLDAIAQNHVARAQLEQQELRELAAFLTPIQRARLLMMRRALMDQVDRVRDRSRPGMMGPQQGQPEPQFQRRPRPGARQPGGPPEDEM